VEVSNTSKPTVKENRISYSIKNKNKQTSLTYVVDNGIIRGVDHVRCDYLMMFPSCQKAFYIELKSQGWKKAIKQLENTYKLIHSQLNEYTPHFRAVVMQGVPRTNYVRLSNITKLIRSRHENATVMIKSRFNDVV